MPGSWKEARETAVKEGMEQVFHDFDKGTFGACRRNEKQGHFASGCFVEHRCICMPSALSADDLGKKERDFLKENPDWLGE
ncbi:MAG: hypothetical protein ABFC24_13155 [Methanoregulaceae archaeon]